MKVDNIVLQDPLPRTLGGASKAASSPAGAQQAGLSTRKIAEEFASLLLSEMLKSMRATLSGEGLDGDKSASREMYSALADGEVTRALSKHDGMGLANFLERSLTQLEQKTQTQEISPATGETSDSKETRKGGR